MQIMISPVFLEMFTHEQSRDDPAQVRAACDCITRAYEQQVKQCKKYQRMCDFHGNKINIYLHIRSQDSEACKYPE